MNKSRKVKHPDWRQVGTSNASRPTNSNLHSQVGQSGVNDSLTSRSHSKPTPKKRKEKSSKSSNLYGYRTGNNKFNYYNGQGGFSNIKDNSLYSNLLSQAQFDVKNSTLSKKHVNTSRHLSSKKDAVQSPKKARSIKTSKLVKSRAKKGKNKMEALFESEFLDFADVERVVDNWTIIVSTLEDLKNEGRVNTLANTFFLRIFLKQYGNFSLVFSSFNQIRLRVKEMMILEFWAFYVVFYFLHEEGGIEPLSLGNLEVVFTLLLRSIYYISLILVKAKKSGILPIQGSSLEKFNYLVKKFNFPTGVPLIKTVKEGNSVIREKLRKILFYTSRRVRRHFEWTMENVKMNYEEVLAHVSVHLSSELKRRSRKVFIQINTGEFFSQVHSPQTSVVDEKKTRGIFENSNLDGSGRSSLKSQIEFHNQLSEKYTASEFLLKALTEGVNSNPHLVSLRQTNRAKSRPAKKNLKSSKSFKSKKKKNKGSVNTSRASNNQSNFSSQYKLIEMSKRNKTTSRRPEKKKDANSRKLIDSKYKIKSSSVSTKKKKKKSGNGLKETGSSFKMNTLLSGLSAKYRPLSNVSELRDSALSIKRENSRTKKKGKKKKTKKKKLGRSKQSESDLSRESTPFGSHKKKFEPSEANRRSATPEGSLKDKINSIRKRLNEPKSRSVTRVEARSRTITPASDPKKEKRNPLQTRVSNNNNSNEEPKSIFTRRKRSLLTSEMSSRNSPAHSQVKPPIQKSTSNNIFKKVESTNTSNLSNNLGQTGTTVLKEKSIIPSESYAKEVGSGRVAASPQIRSNNLITRMTVNSTLMNEQEYYKMTSQGKTGTRSRAKMSRKREEVSPSISQRRTELHENYKKLNAMSHTPDSKSKTKLASTNYIKRSLTPEQKKVSSLHDKPEAQTQMFQMLPLINRKYTLVLDLDETLIHFKTENGKSKFLIRPHTYKFLRNLHPMFELIIFTAAQQQYADWIINKIDTKKYISYRFYRTHCQMSRSAHIKDLSRLSRSLNQMIIVDNCKENFKLQKENGIHIKGWFGNTSDRVLVELEDILKEMVSRKVPDVRMFLAEKFAGRQDGNLSLY